MAHCRWRVSNPVAPGSLGVNNRRVRQLQFFHAFSRTRGCQRCAASTPFAAWLAAAATTIPLTMRPLHLTEKPRILLHFGTAHMQAPRHWQFSLMICSGRASARPPVHLQWSFIVFLWGSIAARPSLCRACNQFLWRFNLPVLNEPQDCGGCARLERRDAHTTRAHVYIRCCPQT